LAAQGSLILHCSFRSILAVVAFVAAAHLLAESPQTVVAVDDEATFVDDNEFMTMNEDGTFL